MEYKVLSEKQFGDLVREFQEKMDLVEAHKLQITFGKAHYNKSIEDVPTNYLVWFSKNFDHTKTKINGKSRRSIQVYERRIRYFAKLIAAINLLVRWRKNSGEEI